MEYVYNNFNQEIQTDITSKRSLLSTVAMLVAIAGGLIASLFFKESWLWMDEVLCYTLVSDPSLAHMNDAIVGSLDANPPLFPNVYWLIGHSISLNPYFLRAVSIGLFALTLALFYRYTTRLTGTPISNFFLFTLVSSLTYLNFTLSTQIRVYSFYLLLGCLYFFVLHKLIRNPAKLRLLALQLLLGLALIMTHNFGAFYVAASLSFFGLLWVWSRQRAYGLVVVSHLLAFGLWFVLWFPNFQVQSQAAKPHTWIPLPTFMSFFRILGELIPTLSSRIEQTPALSFLPILRVGLVVGLFLYIALPRLKRGFRAMVDDEAFSFYIMAGYIAIVVAGAALIMSVGFISVFISRYQWPSALLLLFQLVYAWHYFVPAIRISPKLIRLAVPLYVVGIMGFVFYQNRKIVMFPKDIIGYLPSDKANYPIFFESADYFLPLHFHHVAPAYFLLNWEAALSKKNLPNATTDFKIIDSVREKYGVKEIVSADQFNGQRFPHFYVVDEASRIQIEPYIASGKVKVLRTLPVNIKGHQILECTF